jgi:4-carboxymuconolactone decarboxylase
MMPLSDKDARLVRLFAAVVLGRWEELARLRREAPAGEPDRAWREAVLMSHLFAGFPRTVEAFEVLESAGGLGALDADELEGGGDGRALFDRIYAELADGVRARLTGHHRELAGWIQDHAYGRVLSRSGLSADRRELLAVVALAVTRQDRQLMSHLRGAVRCGATPEEVSAALDVVSDLFDRDAIRPLVERFAIAEDE